MDTDSALAESDTQSRFDDLRRASGFILAPIAFAITFSLTAGQLTPAGRSLAAIMSAVCVLWITESIPLAVTALLGAVLCILLGVASATAVLARFADPIVFLFIGSFMLARAMSLHGLDRRIALSFLSIPWISAHPARMLGGLGLITALISMWVSNTATTAMMLPIALGILGAVHKVRQTSARPAAGATDLRHWPLATGMMLMIAYAASIGGIGTPVGSPPNLITIGLIQESLGVEITFFQWMSLCVPILVAMGGALFALLVVLHPDRKRTAESASHPTSDGADATRSMAQYIAHERAALGRWTPGQINALIAFIVAIVLWTLPGFLSVFLDRTTPLLAFFEARLPEPVVALLAAILLFVLPTNLRRLEFTLDWSQAVRIDWGTILLFGGGLSLGTLMFETGVARALADGITGWTGANSLWSLTAAAIALGIIVSEATSNTAAANMIVPVAIALAQSAGVSPLPPALGACLGASYGFMLPVSTPPNTIVYGSGLVPITKMIRAGLIFDLVGFAIILAGLRVLCPLLGLT
ncbi:MAG: DASS family sodium-coupled anion symporter [Pirellulales bacterium]